MRFLPEVEVRGERMFEHMYDEVAQQDQRRRRSCQGKTFRDHFQQHRSQHETRTQRDEVLQGFSGPLVRRNNDAPENVGPCSREREDEGLKERAHPECRIVMISPSLTGYSFPSSRKSPFSSSACIVPCFTNSS